MADVPNSHSTNINFQEIIRAKELIVKESSFEKVYRYFFGDDIFISHSRFDGINYASNLARLLQKKYRLKCFADFYWTEVGEKLPAFLVRKLKRCSVLVVVITEGAEKRSENIKEEIEIFKKTGRPILVIDLVNNYQKDKWIELHGVNVIKGFSEKRVSLDTKSKPLLFVLKRIKDSFNYKTKYDQQRRSAFTAFSLLFLSFVAIIGTSIYANSKIALASDATREKNAAIEERDSAKSEREISLKEINKINQEMTVVQNKLNKAQNELDITQVTLKDKEAEVTRTKADLEKTSEEKQKAETAATAAKVEELKAKENSKQLDIIALGSQASNLSATQNRKFTALKLAVEAADKGLESNKKFFDEMPAEVQKGLTDAVIATDFARPLKNDIGNVEFTEISPNGELILGEIRDSKTGKFKAVIWETAKPNEYHLLKKYSLGDRVSVREEAFSRDGKWLFIVSFDRIELWEITQERGNYKFTFISKLQEEDGYFTHIDDISSNKDGTQIAVLFFDRSSGADVIKTINRNGTNLYMGENIQSPIKNPERIIFSPQDELIIGADGFEIYNTAKKELFPKEKKESNFLYPKYQLDDVTDSGDFILREMPGSFFKKSRNEDRSFRYMLVNSRDGSNICRWERVDPTGESKLTGISSFRFVNGRATEVSYISNQLSVINYLPMKNSFVYDFKTMPDESEDFFHFLNFYFLNDNNTLGFYSHNSAGIIDKQTGVWNQIASVGNLKVNSPSWIEKTEENLYFTSYNQERRGNQLLIKNLKTDKVAQCMIDNNGKFLHEKSFLFHAKYPVFLQIARNADGSISLTSSLGEEDVASFEKPYNLKYQDLFLSIYDPTDCRKIVKIKLEAPEPASEKNSSYYSESDVKVSLRDLSLDEDGVLRGILDHDSCSPGVVSLCSPEGSWMITWDLNKIELTRDLVSDNRTSLPANIYDLPFESNIFITGASNKFFALSHKSARPMIWMTDYNNRHFLFEFKDQKWDKKKLELNDIEQKSFLKDSIVFSKSGDLVAHMDGLTVRIWDMDTGKRKLTLNIPKNIMDADSFGDDNKAKGFFSRYVEKTPPIIFSPDEKSIGVVAKNKQIKFYPTSIKDFYYLAKEILK